MPSASWIALGAMMVGGQGVLAWLTYLLGRRQRQADLRLTKAQEEKLAREAADAAIACVEAQRDECRENLAMAIAYIIDVADAAREGKPIPPVPIPLWMVVRNA